MPKNETIIALYGNVSIPKAYCDACQREAFLIHGRFACCDKLIRLADAAPTRFVRMSSPELRRKQPTAKERKRILYEQDGRCFYCGALFWSEGIRYGTQVRIQMVWDHQMPFSYSQDNRSTNFVAACHVCNTLKSAKVFQTVDDAKVYLHLARRQKGYDW